MWKKQPGPSKTTRTPENVEAGIQTILTSPKRFIPTNMQLLLQFLIAQWDEFFIKTWNSIHMNWQWCNSLIQAILLHQKYNYGKPASCRPCVFQRRDISICQDMWINKACDVGVTRTPENFRYLHAERVTGVLCPESALFVHVLWREHRAITVTSARYVNMYLSSYSSKICGLPGTNVDFIARTLSWTSRLFERRSSVATTLAIFTTDVLCDSFLRGYLKSLVYSNRPKPWMGWRPIFLLLLPS